jgi:hypothetical protein
MTVRATLIGQALALCNANEFKWGVTYEADGDELHAHGVELRLQLAKLIPARC